MSTTTAASSTWTSVDLRENEAAGAAGSGGGVLNVLGGDLTADDVLLTGNRAQRAGGGIETVGGVTELTDVAFDKNVVATNPGNGGALHITGAGSVSFIGGRVVANRAGNEGGGLWNSTGTMLVRDVVLRGNVARGGSASDNGGGALYNDGGTLRVRDSRLARNRAPGTSGSGGGILNNQGSLVVRASRVVENVSTRAGGGIETNAGQVRLVNVDLLRNRTAANPGNGGGLHTTDAGVVDYTGGSVIENVAASEGGGLWNSATGTMTVDERQHPSQPGARRPERLQRRWCLHRRRPPDPRRLTDDRGPAHRRRAGEAPGASPAVAVSQEHGGAGGTVVVEPRGLEPLTPCLQSRCATNCAMAPGRRPDDPVTLRASAAALDAVGGLGPESLLVLGLLGLGEGHHATDGGRCEKDDLLHGGPFLGWA